MKKKIKIVFLLVLLVIPLIACTNYKKIVNTKSLSNYEYTLRKSIQINQQKEELIEEQGYVNGNIEKRIVKLNDKQFTTYFEKSKNGTFIYKENKNGEYERKRLPCNNTSYVDMIDKDWFIYENGEIKLNKESNIKLLKILHIHKYMADDIELNDINYKDDGKYITHLYITFDLLKNNEKVGNANIEFNISNIDGVSNINLPNLKERH